MSVAKSGDELNGLSVSGIKGLLQTISSNTETTRQLGRWRARVRWLGGLKAKSYVRSHSVIVDEAADLSAADTAPNAVEYVLSALGGCLIAGFVLNATKEDVKVHDAEIAIEGNIDNILTFLGLSDQGHSGYRDVTVKLYVKADADEKTLGRLWQYTVQTSPVGNTLVRTVDLKPDISVIR